MVAMNDPYLDNLQKYGYHKGNDITIPQHQTCRQAFLDLANRMERLLPEGRAKQQFKINLQEASMWANFAIAEQAPLAE